MNFPVEFDTEFYRGRHDDTRNLTALQCLEHYEKVGKHEGRWPSHYAGRYNFIELIPKTRILEIGPGANPVCKGPNVRYFDAIDTAALKARAQTFGESVEDTPTIHYFSPTGDLSVVDGTFPVVFSSHAIEHQTDIVRHLQQVEALLEPQGLYFVICPDMRYTLDRHMSPSTIGDVLEAWAYKHTHHRLANIINAYALHTHNEGWKHWENFEEAPKKYSPERIHQALELWRNQTGYIDVHGWFFTPDSFRLIFDTVADMGLTKLRPVRVYQTPRNANEFCVIFAIP